MKPNKFDGISQEHLGTLVGMIYGDGYLNVRKRKTKTGKSGYISSEMRIVHSIRQLEYLQYKSEIIAEIFGRGHTISIYQHVLPKLNKSYKMCGFSKSSKYFRHLKELMYDGKKKVFRREVLDLLTPQGIAIWYMDDGSAGRNFNKEGKVSSVYSCIATYCSEEEAQTICNYFLDTFNIEFRIGYERSKKAHIVRANTYSSKQFAELIGPHIIPSMMYKLSHVEDLAGHEREASRNG